LRPALTTGIIVFLVALTIFELSINGVYDTDHSTSIVQLDYALWSNHSVALNSANVMRYHTVDDFRFNNQTYSAEAPGVAFLALPFLGLAFTISSGYTVFGPVLILSETFVSLTAAIAVYLTYKIATFFFRRSTSVFLGFIFAFSTICWPFATYFFQSDVSAMFVLLAAYFALKTRKGGKPEVVPWFLCGVALGAAFSVDYVDGILLFVFLAFLVASNWASRGSAAVAAGAFAVGAIPGLAGVAAYNFAIFGNPLVTTEQAYLGQSSVFGAFTNPVLGGLALDLVSLARGLFVFSPVLVLGVAGLVKKLMEEGHRLEFVLFLAIFVAVLLPYSAWYEPAGGISFGPRFLVAVIPFLTLPAGVIIEDVAGRWMWGVYAAYLAGALMNGIAALVTTIPPESGPNVSPFFSHVLPKFTAGGLDSWWVGYLGVYWPYMAAFVLGLGTVIPILWNELARRRENRGPDTDG
jgi:hypothetical protein